MDKTRLIPNQIAQVILEGQVIDYVVVRMFDDYDSCLVVRVKSIFKNPGAEKVLFYLNEGELILNGQLVYVNQAGWRVPVTSQNSGERCLNIKAPAYSIVALDNTLLQ